MNERLVLILFGMRLVDSLGLGTVFVLVVPGGILQMYMYKLLSYKRTQLVLFFVFKEVLSALYFKTFKKKEGEDKK